MKRKAARKAKPARKTRPIRKGPSTAPAAGGSDSLVTPLARTLGLAIDPAWEANVTFNLQLIMRHAALVDEFVLPDDAEPAPIFRA